MPEISIVKMKKDFYLSTSSECNHNKTSDRQETLSTFGKYFFISIVLSVRTLLKVIIGIKTVNKTQNDMGS